MKERFINWLIRFLKADTNKISDGYHTYSELYHHRILLFILLMKYAHKLGHETWFSRYHSDGSQWPGWIVAGIGKEHGKQITYHMNSLYTYELTRYGKFAEELDRAPEWDGHSSRDVTDRLQDLILFGEIRKKYIDWP